MSFSRRQNEPEEHRLVGLFPLDVLKTGSSGYEPG